jgi:hypothetical protein
MINNYLFVLSKQLHYKIIFIMRISNNVAEIKRFSREFHQKFKAHLIKR